jgi:hypothetical protein
MGWWLGLHQPPWSFGFDSQTRGTRENRRPPCALPKILSLSVLFGPGPQGARIGRSFQSVSEARPKKIESNILFGKKGWFVNLKGCWFLLFGSTLVVKKQEKDFTLQKRRNPLQHGEEMIVKLKKLNKITEDHGRTSPLSRLSRSRSSL